MVYDKLTFREILNVNSSNARQSCQNSKTFAKRVPKNKQTYQILVSCSAMNTQESIIGKRTSICVAVKKRLGQMQYVVLQQKLHVITKFRLNFKVQNEKLHQNKTTL